MFVRIFFCCISVMASAMAHAQWFERHAAIMGTNIDIKIEHHDKKIANALLEQSLSLLRQIDQQMSHYKAESELSRINREAFSTPLRIEKNLFELIEKALAVSELSQGAFDITYASVGYLYDYPKAVKPDQNTIKKKLAGVNYRNIVLDKKAQTIRFSHKDTRIDLGGIAKGYAVDEVIHYLKKESIQAAMVTAGGDTRILGKKADKAWMVGIKNPQNPDETALLLPLEEETAISTSGDYERFFIDGTQTRHHHIINPQTGKNPTHNIRSVTILGPDATTTDGLSTSVFVLGIEKGLALVNRLPGIDAIIISADGKLHFSADLQQIK